MTARSLDRVAVKERSPEHDGEEANLNGQKATGAAVATRTPTPVTAGPNSPRREGRRSGSARTTPVPQPKFSRPEAVTKRGGHAKHQDERRSGRRRYGGFGHRTAENHRQRLEFQGAVGPRCLAGLFKAEQNLIDFDGGAGRHVDGLYFPGGLGGDVGLHLHGLQHHQQIVGLNLLTRGYVHARHQAGQRTADQLAIVRAGSGDLAGASAAQWTGWLRLPELRGPGWIRRRHPHPLRRSCPQSRFSVSQTSPDRREAAGRASHFRNEGHQCPRPRCTRLCEA